MATLTPYLTIRDATAAIEFYKRAFGAREEFRMAAPDGKRIMHAALVIGDSSLFLSDEFTESVDCTPSPTKLGGSSVTIHMASPDVDATMARAAAAGATVTMPAADMFWGDRYGRLRDPFGHEWSIATHKRQVAPEQMRSAMMEQMGRQQQQQQQQ